MMGEKESKGEKYPGSFSPRTKETSTNGIPGVAYPDGYAIGVLPTSCGAYLFSKCLPIPAPEGFRLRPPRNPPETVTEPPGDGSIIGVMGVGEGSTKGWRGPGDVWGPVPPYSLVPREIARPGGVLPLPWGDFRGGSA